MMSQGMLVLSRLRLYWSMVQYGRAHNLDFAREHWRFFVQMRRELAERGIQLRASRVLEIGCGKAAWLTILLHSAGARAVGIDTEWTRPGVSPGKYLAILRQNGLERAARTLVWDLLYARPYYRELQRVADMQLDFEVDCRSGSALELEFDDDSFDIVVSHEVFEHLPDLDGSFEEVARVLAPDGRTYIYFHNFASISGGHHIAWKYPDTEPSETVPAWDHLRQNLHPDIPSWINRQRLDAYRSAAESALTEVEWLVGDREGEALLTDDIRQELSNYSEEELLTKGWTIIGRPQRRQ